MAKCYHLTPLPFKGLNSAEKLKGVNLVYSTRPISKLKLDPIRSHGCTYLSCYDHVGPGQRSWPSPLTFWLQNLISSSLSRVAPKLQTWWNCPYRFTEYRVCKLWDTTFGTHTQKDNQKHLAVGGGIRLMQNKLKKPTSIANAKKNSQCTWSQIADPVDSETLLNQQQQYTCLMSDSAAYSARSWVLAESSAAKVRKWLTKIVYLFIKFAPVKTLLKKSRDSDSWYFDFQFSSLPNAFNNTWHCATADWTKSECWSTVQGY